MAETAHPESRPGDTVARWALALIACAASHGALAQDPARVVRLHFSVDPAGFSEVRDSVGLMKALREHLLVDAVSPLDIELTIQVGYRVFQTRSDGMETMGFDQTTPESVQGAGISLTVDPRGSLKGRVRDLPFQTFADWDEVEAWNQFRTALEGQLAYSPWSSGAFLPGENGVVALRVESVGDGDTAFEPDGKKMLFEVTAQTLYRTDARFGSPAPPDGYEESLRTVVFQLAPTAEAGGSDDVAAATAHATAEAKFVPAAASPGGVITGVYGIDRGRMVVAEVDGQLVFYNGNLPEPTHWPLTLIEGTRYSARYNETPVEVKFSVNEEGRAFAMTVVQDGHELRLPRKE